MRLPARKLNPSDLPARFPRLSNAMRQAALLTASEVGGCLYMLARGEEFAGEAVNHYGGPRAVLSGAIRVRHYARAMRRH